MGSLAWHDLHHTMAAGGWIQQSCADRCRLPLASGAGGCGGGGGGGRTGGDCDAGGGVSRGEHRGGLLAGFAGGGGGGCRFGLLGAGDVGLDATGNVGGFVEYAGYDGRRGYAVCEPVSASLDPTQTGTSELRIGARGGEANAWVRVNFSLSHVKRGIPRCDRLKAV